MKSRTKSLIQSVPEPGPVNRNLEDMRALPSEGYHVYSWSAGKVGENVPVTEVHLALPVEVAGVRADIILKLKSPRALDELVAVLLNHRTEVWGTK